MEFKKENVYTALNADELNAGDKVITAYGLASLKSLVIADYTSEELLDVIEKVQLIEPDGLENRIATEEGSFPFAYLVERAEEKKWRPYKNCHEMIADFKKRFNVCCPDYTVPLIWAKSNIDTLTSLVTDFCIDKIYMSNLEMYLEGLFKDYTYLDGTPCGIEE